MDICSYPQLFAAYHVLRRLREPRHPSCALVTFLLFLGVLSALARRRTRFDLIQSVSLAPLRISAGVRSQMFLQSFESDAILQSLISRCFVCRLFDLTVPRFPDLRQAPRLQSSQYVNVLFFEWRITDSNR